MSTELERRAVLFTGVWGSFVTRVHPSHTLTEEREGVARIATWEAWTACAGCHLKINDDNADALARPCPAAAAEEERATSRELARIATAAERIAAAVELLARTTLAPAGGIATASHPAAPTRGGDT